MVSLVYHGSYCTKLAKLEVFGKLAALTYRVKNKDPGLVVDGLPANRRCVEKPQGGMNHEYNKYPIQSSIRVLSRKGHGFCTCQPSYLCPGLNVPVPIFRRPNMP